MKVEHLYERHFEPEMHSRRIVRNLLFSLSIRENTKRVEHHLCSTWHVVAIGILGSVANIKCNHSIALAVNEIVGERVGDPPIDENATVYASWFKESRYGGTRCNCVDERAGPKDHLVAAPVVGGHGHERDTSLRKRSHRERIAQESTNA